MRWNGLRSGLGVLMLIAGVAAGADWPVRGIGVNYFDCFYRTLKDKGASCEAGFAALGEHHIPFARFAACGYWAGDMKLYLADKEEYFRRLDAVVEYAGKHHVGLVPCLFWAYWTVPDLMGETCDQWGNAGSKTRAFMRAYTREVVTRYEDSPAVVGWEFGNEFNLSMDLPAGVRPPVVVAMGTPAVRSGRDELTGEMVASAVKEFAEEVRKIDGRRMIVSGHSIPRASAAHLREKHNWDRDTPAEQAREMAGQNPAPCDAISVHLYTDEDFARLPALVKGAGGRPLFVGEFGVSTKEANGRAKFDGELAAILKSGAPMAAVWVYDYAGQEDDWSVTFDNGRAYQLKAIEEANAKWLP